MTPTLTVIIFAFFGGLLPAIIWLFFWLREDSLHPEPNKLIILTFLLGFFTVPIAFFLEYMVNFLFLKDSSIESELELFTISAILVLTLWAFIEEYLKYIAAKLGGLNRKANNEPIDPIIYMITAALGFSAAENILFIITPILDGSLTDFFIVSNMRFVGATLLHVSASALVGLTLSFSYFKRDRVKKEYVFFGLTLATLLHVLFNFIIMSSNISVMLSFLIVWLAIVVIILLFEKVKKIHLNKIK